MVKNIRIYVARNKRKVDSSSGGWTVCNNHAYHRARLFGEKRHIFFFIQTSFHFDRKIQKKCRKLSIDPPKRAVQCPFQPLLNPSEEKNAIGLSRYAEYQGDLTNTYPPYSRVYVIVEQSWISRYCLAAPDQERGAEWKILSARYYRAEGAIPRGLELYRIDDTVKKQYSSPQRRSLAKDGLRNCSKYITICLGLSGIIRGKWLESVARRRRRVQSGTDQMAHARSSREERAELRSLPPVSRNSIFRRKFYFAFELSRVMIIDTSGIAVSR